MPAPDMKNNHLKKLTMTRNHIAKYLLAGAFAALAATAALASSHREAPMIADDPLADNVDLYAFRSPDASNTITIIATYVPLQLPQGGPNYYSFGENIRYEVHIDNDATKPGDEIVYRFTFNRMNEDPQLFSISGWEAEPQNDLYARTQHRRRGEFPGDRAKRHRAAS
jgi:hypothetical protein